MDLFKLGKDKDSGKIVEVSEVKSGLDCNCVCPNCGKDLVAAQGEKTEWYFRHYEQASDCKTGPEKGIQELKLLLWEQLNTVMLQQKKNQI